MACCSLQFLDAPPKQFVAKIGRTSLSGYDNRNTRIRHNVIILWDVADSRLGGFQDKKTCSQGRKDIHASELKTRS
jgi:hypothetical protein